MIKLVRFRKYVTPALLAVLVFGGIALSAAEAPAAGAAPVAAAAPAAEINTGDTAWVLTSSALVLMMTIPGLALFYGGLVRRKNVLSVLMQCFFITGMVSIFWVVLGYSLAFGPDVGGKGLIGGLQWAFLTGVGLTPDSFYGTTVPHQAFMIFQCMFAVITPALIAGAFAERMKFAGFCVFSLLWVALVYAPVAHWVWAKGGILGAEGTLDFAGGTVVHINAGMAALAAALVLGKRKGYPNKISPPHNLPFAVIGASLLWVGWFGFNAGSALSANGIAANAFVVTHIAAATAAVTWALIDWIVNKHATVLGTITGAVGGLVAITPAAGFVSITGALAIGAGVSAICYFFVAYLKPKFGYDDSLDAFGVHGVGGIWGALATGLFATKAVNAAGNDGLFYGNPGLFLIQLKATVISIIFAFVMSVVLLKLVDFLIGLRVTEQSERIGLDLTEHRESGYTILE
ncbi:MAG: ammonium transporter [Victivallaceae bacterium]